MFKETKSFAPGHTLINGGVWNDLMCDLKLAWKTRAIASELLPRKTKKHFMQKSWNNE